MIPELTIGWGVITAVFLAAYLLGSVPFGVVIAKLMGLGNLRDIGSGNIGATNVLRTGSKKAALMTLLLDGGKGAVAVLIARHFYGDTAAQIAALAAFLGHIYPVYLGFRGGKGMATFLGIMLALNPWVGLACCAAWMATAVIFRISSLAALVSAASAPIWLALFGMISTTGLGLLLAALVWMRHHSNITRIIKGVEPKIGAK